MEHDYSNECRGGSAERDAPSPTSQRYAFLALSGNRTRPLGARCQFPVRQDGRAVVADHNRDRPGSLFWRRADDGCQHVDLCWNKGQRCSVPGMTEFLLSLRAALLVTFSRHEVVADSRNSNCAGTSGAGKRCESMIKPDGIMLGMWECLSLSSELNACFLDVADRSV